MNKYINITLLVIFTLICIYLLIKSCNNKELFANQEKIIQYPFYLTDTITDLTNSLNDKIAKEVATMNNKVSESTDLLSSMKNNITSPVANIGTLQALSSNIDSLNIGNFNLKQTIKDNKKTLELRQGDNILATFTSDDIDRIKLYKDNNNNISINNIVTGTPDSGYTLNGNLNINGTLKIGNNITIKSDNNEDVINIGNSTTATNGKTKINIGKYSLVPNLSGSDDYIELRYNNDKVIGKFSKNAGDKAVIYTNDNNSNYFFINSEPALGMSNNTSGINGNVKVNNIDTNNIKTQNVSTNTISATRYNINGNGRNYNIRDDNDIFTLYSDNTKLLRYRLPNLWNTGDVLSVRLNNDGSKHMYAKPDKVDVGNLPIDRR